MSEVSAFLTTVSSGFAGIHNPAAAPRFSLLIVTHQAEPAAAMPLWVERIASEVEFMRPGRWPDGCDPDAVIIDAAPEDVATIEHAVALAARLRDTAISVFVLGERLSRRQRITLYRAGVMGCLAVDEDPEELAVRLSSLVAAKRTASAGLARLRQHARHLDEQLRLAQRLQMDFLPRRLPEIENGRFAARLEPAAWVAGDFYDIFRLDERRVGFYVADAVGHGIPAALLTVFVKKSLQTKRIEGKQYELIPPCEALALLNADLLSADLQETSFITMVYGIFDEVTHEVSYARAGHPKPLILDAEGAMTVLDGDGPLLGVFKGATFEARTRKIVPGERLFLYSDGAERVQDGRRADPARLFEVIREAGLLPAEVLLESVLDAVRAATGGQPLADDVTLVALELDPPAVADET
jgi:phosphoserine phosphatase RsbU/P